jgi:hypothetical protein
MDLTRELVEHKYGRGQLVTLRPVLRAVSIRLVHARIHHRDYTRLLKTHFDEPLQGGVSMWELMVTSDDEAIGANNMFFITCEAHLYACVQALHALADNLAHVAYYTLGWNLENKPPLHKVSMSTVLERLRQMMVRSIHLVPIYEVFADLRSKSQYDVLSEITNHLKHHGGLNVSLALGPNDDEPYRVMMSSFLRNEVQHPQREISAYLEEAYATMNRAMVQIGCALNNWLAHNP